jgi:hypothetical protein
MMGGGGIHYIRTKEQLLKTTIVLRFWLLQKQNKEMGNKKIKIQTYKGEIITLDVENETEINISGHDKFGVFVKIEKIDIKNSRALTKKEEEGFNEQMH